MRQYLRRLVATMFMVALLSACTSIDVMHISGAEGNGTAAAGTSTYKLGETEVEIMVAGSGQYAFVALHENESTSVAAAKQVMKSVGGQLIELKHSGAREISFSFNGQRYSVDPNRMFTDAGIKTNLKGGYSPEVHVVVKGLADAVINKISGRTVIALHNSTDGAYSVLDYKRGGRYEGDAADVHVNPEHDPDDFFFVTSASLFARIKQAGFNVVLQSRNVTDDGSLSVYASRRGLGYVNVEAQNGHLTEQVTMLRLLLE